MGNYYFLIASFPPLSLGQKPEASLLELQEELALNLSVSDLEKVALLLRPIELYNLRAFWLQEPFDPRGLFTKNQWQEALLVQEDLPSYLVEFLDRYESTEERLAFFSSLFVSLYQDPEVQQTPFLLQYYQFERQVRLVLLGLRAKEAKKDLLRELQFEDPTDPSVSSLLAQRDAEEYIPPQGYEELKTIFEQHRDHPEALNLALLEYRYDYIEEMEEPQEFGIDRVLAYLARLLIAEAFFDLQTEKGRELLNRYE